MKRKPRKPRPIKNMFYSGAVWGGPHDYEIHMQGHLDLRDAKTVHRWLGQAIAYLEGRKR